MKKAISLTKGISVLFSEKEAKPISKELFDHVIEQIDATYVERTFQMNMSGIQAIHEVGYVLRDTEKKNKINITQLVERCAANNRMQEIKLGKTRLWGAIKIYDTWPKIEDIPGGKNISINKVLALVMPPKPKVEPTVEDVAAGLYRKYDIRDLKKIYTILGRLIKQHEEDNTEDQK